MLIRKYRDSDLDALLSSWEKASRLAHPFLTDEYFQQERKNIPEIHLPNAETWVVETSNEVVGFIALIGNEVGAIFVHPGMQGKGAGKALMDKAQELHENLEVEVFSKNSIGRRFYSKYGFVLIEEKYHENTGHKMLRLKFTARRSVRRRRNSGRKFQTRSCNDPA